MTREYKEPESDLNIPKIVKKTSITWIITGMLCLLCLGILALGRAQVTAMLVGYETKANADSVQAMQDRRIDALLEEIKSLKDTVGVLDRKLDHLQYTIDYNQSHDGNKALSPKQKDDKN